MSKSAAESVIDLYHAQADAWEGLRRQDLIERGWLDRFLASLPPEGRDILDLGCGTGQPMAAYLIGKGCRITGVDGAAGMIARARQSFPGQTWIQADLRTLPPLCPFHGLLAWHSLFHLPAEDQRRLLGSLARLGLPGAALMFTSGTIAGEAIGSLGGQPLYHASLDSAEYRALLRANGFQVLAHVEEDAGCGGATVWLARKATER